MGTRGIQRGCKTRVFLQEAGVCGGVGWGWLESVLYAVSVLFVFCQESLGWLEVQGMLPGVPILFAPVSVLFLLPGSVGWLEVQGMLPGVPILFAPLFVLFLLPGSVGCGSGLSLLLDRRVRPFLACCCVLVFVLL